MRRITHAALKGDYEPVSLCRGEHAAALCPTTRKADADIMNKAKPQGNIVTISLCPCTMSCPMYNHHRQQVHVPCSGVGVEHIHDQNKRGPEATVARLQPRPGVFGDAVAPYVREVFAAAIATEHDHLAAQHDRAVGVPLLRRLWPGQEATSTRITQALCAALRLRCQSAWPAQQFWDVFSRFAWLTFQLPSR